MFDYKDSCYSWFVKIYLSNRKTIIKEFDTYYDAVSYCEKFTCNYDIYKSLLIRRFL